MITIELHTQEGYGQLQPPAVEEAFADSTAAMGFLAFDLWPRIEEAGLDAGGFVLIAKVDEDDEHTPPAITLDAARELED